MLNLLPFFAAAAVTAPLGAATAAVAGPMSRVSSHHHHLHGLPARMLPF